MSCFKVLNRYTMNYYITMKENNKHGKQFHPFGYMDISRYIIIIILLSLGIYSLILGIVLNSLWVAFIVFFLSSI